MAWHANYWSCSKFADFVRGTKKLKCGTSEEWAEWEEKSSSAHSFRHWVAEEFLDKVQDMIFYPRKKIDDFLCYIENRWITKSNSLTANPRDIKPGDWCDVGNRFLPCLFNELVDFVEIECAWMNYICDETVRKKYKIPIFHKFRKWRSPELGVNYLKWETTLTNTDFCDETDPDYGKPTQQALNATEKLELYDWWKNVRPNRKDPYEESGWSEHCKNNRPEFGRKNTPEEREHTLKLLDKLGEIETAHEKEDEEMMIRLIRIRNSLWT